jgi:uncharacterized protein (TIGR03083 family)
VWVDSAWLITMDSTRLRTCLDDDYRTLRAAIAGTDLTTRVPSCPDWTTADLAAHVAEVYQHKTECIRLGTEPTSWEPETLDPDPLTALEATYAALLAQFDAHDPADRAGSWYKPNQTVGFHIRRMAQETVIHRVDAELAAAAAATAPPTPIPSPIPEDLALDGIDEFLNAFLAYGSRAWSKHFADLLATPDERPLLLTTGDNAWLVRALPEGVLVEEHPLGSAPQDPAATATATVQALLLWLWNRTDDTTVSLSGDPNLLTQFGALRSCSTS